MKTTHINKIIYKFIGRKLCFAVENKGLLTLNSANVICLNDNYDAFFVCAILNSRITQLFFEDSYDTHKVLKNHIKSFYIPNFEKKIVLKISGIAKNQIGKNNYCEDIEDIIYSELGLNDNQVNYLRARFP